MRDGEKVSKSSLSRQLLLHGIVPVVLGIGLATILILYIISGNVMDFLEDEVQNEAELTCERLNRHFEKYIQLIGQARYNKEFQHYMKEVEKSEEALTNAHFELIQEILDSQLDTPLEDPLKGVLWIADVDANTVVEDSGAGYVLTPEEGWVFEDRPWAELAFQSEAPFLSRAYQSKDTGELVVSLICPVRDWESRMLLGVFGVDIKVENLKKVVHLGHDAKKDKDKIIILDENGVILKHPDESMILKEYSELEEASIIDEALKTGEKGPYRYACDDDKMIGSVLKVESTNWTIISSIPVSKMNRKLQSMIGPFSIGCVLYLLLGLYYEYRVFRKWILCPLREVESAAKHISQGDLDFELKMPESQEMEQIAYTLDSDVKALLMELKEKNQHNTESIEYARFLQNRIGYVPEHKRMKLEDTCYMSRPVDMVSGDFLWGTPAKTGGYIMLGDCTGHGMPGALLTVMVISMLQGIIENEENEEPAYILWRLNQLLYEGLYDDESENKFNAPAGVDMVLAYVEEKTKKMSVAASGLNLYREKDEVVETIRGEKLTLGERMIESPDFFTTYDFNWEEGVSYYMATDGLFDQPGGDRRLPFGYNRMKRVVIKYRDASMEEIVNKVMEEYDDYKAEERQRDDVTVFGFRL